jgi:hypothetical protein
MTISKCREAFEARYRTEIDKRALAKNDDGHYVLMQTYVQWVSFQLGWEAQMSLANQALKKINDMLSNAIGAGELRPPISSQDESRLWWIFDVTKEALSQCDNQPTN